MTHCPPKSCMPSRAKTTMNRKRRNSKLMMDFMELRRETTRFLREFQYLRSDRARTKVTFRTTQAWQSGKLLLNVSVMLFSA